MKPLVSILIPAYNAQDWVGASIRSALAQTWENKEIIVVDDGSRDQTLAVANQFQSDTVRVISQRNQGAAVARNTAFAASHGDYIQWLDADDLLAPNKIASQMAVLEQGGNKRALASGPWGRFLYRHRQAQFTPTSLWCDLSPVEFLIRKMEQNLHQQTATWLVSRELTEAAGSWNPALLVDDDGEYFCRVLLASERVVFVPDAKVYYRASGSGSLSYLKPSDRKLGEQWRSMRLHIGYVRSLEESPRVRKACVQYLQNWLMFFYPERPDVIAEMESTARELGGALQTPRLPWKYSWIELVCGRRLAKRVQFVLPTIRWSLARVWDRAMFRREADRVAGPEGL